MGTGVIGNKISPTKEERDMTLAEITEKYQRKVIKDRLRRYGNNLAAKRKIAADLSISIATLYRKLKG